MVKSGRVSSLRAEDVEHHHVNFHRLVPEPVLRSCDMSRRALPVALVTVAHWPDDDQQRSGTIAECALGGSWQTAAHDR